MSKRSQQTKRPAPLCGYCGTKPSSTSDHVIPRQLFIEVPGNAITVRACLDCNQAKKACDEYLHDWLVLDWQGSEHKVARERFEGPLSRAIGRRQSDLVREIVPRLRWSRQYSTAGLYLGDYPAAPIDVTKLQQAMAYIVRGLTYKLKSHRIPDDYFIAMDRVDPLNLSRALEHMLNLGAKSPFVMGDKVVIILRVAFAEDPMSCIWMFIFYGAVMLRVFVESPALRLQLEAEQKERDRKLAARLNPHERQR